MASGDFIRQSLKSRVQYFTPKGKAIRRAIRAAGAKLFFLPKYSPDLNPIEQVFAKLKHLLRKAAARTLEAVIAAIGQLLGTYTPQECTNYFTHAGYGQT
jgi:transposase